MDWPFLERQCFADRALERELLLLFVANAARLVAALPALSPGEQDDAAHRLKGSSQGIGAWAVARLAGTLENAAPVDRRAALDALPAALAKVEQAIRIRLATP